MGKDYTGGHIDVDLDGTLAEHYTDTDDHTKIGAPVPAMVEKVKRWLDAGVEVRIFTARAAGKNLPDHGKVMESIHNWVKENIGQRLTVTPTKDFGTLLMYDDRAIQIVRNTGKALEELLPDAVAKNLKETRGLDATDTYEVKYAVREEIRKLMSQD